MRTRPLTIGEFDREKKWWKKRKTSEYAWKVSAKEIAKGNYNLDSKNPHEEEVNLGAPDELMAEYLEISERLKASQNKLKQELMKSLGDSY